MGNGDFDVVNLNVEIKNNQIFIKIDNYKIKRFCYNFSPQYASYNSCPNISLKIMENNVFHSKLRNL